MFHKILVVVALVFSFNVASAKAKAAKAPKAQKQVSLAYDHNVFLKLNKKARLAYIQAYVDFAVRVEQEKNKGKKSASFLQNLENLLMPQADANGYMCFNAGIIYPGANEAECNRAEVPANLFPAANSFYNHCGADQAPCALGLGVTVVDNQVRGLCYPKSAASTATGTCNRLSREAGGVATLTTRLAACNPNTGNAQCTQLLNAIKQQTDPLDSYCTSGTHRRACNNVKTAVANFRTQALGSAGGTVDQPLLNVAAVNTGCSAVEHAAVNHAISRHTNRKIDPRWLKMISLSEKACNNTNFNFMRQLQKFGACFSNDNTNVDRMINADHPLNSALQRIESNGAMSAQEKAAFTEFFGIDGREFGTLFCNSGTSQAFAAEVEKMRVGNMTPTDKTRMVADYVLSQPSTRISEIADRAADGTFKTQLKDYARSLDANAGLAAQREAARTQCNAGNQAQCAEFRTLRNRFEQATREGAALRQNIYGRMTADPATAGSWGGATTGMGRMFGAALANDLLNQAQTAANQANFNNGGMTARALEQRTKFMECAKQSVNIQVAPGSTALNPQVTASSNIRGCHQRVVSATNNMSYSNPNAKYVLKNKTDGQCLLGSGPATANAACSGASAINVMLGLAVAEGLDSTRSQPRCVNDVNSQYTVYEIFCDDSMAADPAPAGGTTIEI